MTTGKITDKTGNGVHYGPRPKAVGFTAVGGIVLAVLATSQSDRTGRLFVGFGAGLLLLAAAWAGFGGGFVGANNDGVWVRGLWRRQHHDWAEISHIRAQATPRLGLTQRSLEIEAGDRLIVLPDVLLGTDPAEAAAGLSALRPVPDPS